MLLDLVPTLGNTFAFLFPPVDLRPNVMLKLELDWTDDKCTMYLCLFHRVGTSQNFHHYSVRRW